MAIYQLFFAVYCLIVVQASKIEDVQDLNHEPKVAVHCGNIAKYVDIDSGEWVDDVNQTELCSPEAKTILEYCQKTYPKIHITNIVEANENVTLCSGNACESQFTAVPYRCLVGEFEADALSYPPNAECDFGYVYEQQTCRHKDFWHERATAICKERKKKLEKHGILISCGIDLFTGVEYVCCKKERTPAERFQEMLIKFASHIPSVSKGCDRSKYNLKSRILHAEKDKKIKALAKDLKEAKSRMRALKEDDPEQARSLFRDDLKMLEETIRSTEKQARLEESRVRQERRECIQMDINHKKHMAMKSFIDAVRQHRDTPSKVLKTFKRFMRILESDQSQNARFLKKPIRVKSGLAKKAKELAAHTNSIKKTLEDGVEVLKSFDSVFGKLDFSQIDLPSFARDIVLPVHTEAPTVAVNPTDPPFKMTNSEENKDVPYEDDLPPENEHEKFSDQRKPAGKFGKHHGQGLDSGGGDGSSKDPMKHHGHGDHPLKSRAVFAAVIGLSCGALVIMVVIVLALFFRKGSNKRSTKTVVAEPDSQEKRHLLKMQEDGFENPTYKFFAS